MIELEQKSKPLTLKRNTSPKSTGIKTSRSKKLYKPTPVKKHKKLTKAELLARNEKQQRQDNIEKAQVWLCKTFPKVFNKTRLVPLEIGIHKKIAAVHKAQGGSDILGFGWQPLKRALRKWTSRPAYIRLLTEESLFRRSEVGGIAGEVTEEQAAIAKKAVRKLKAKRKKTNNKK